MAYCFVPTSSIAQVSSSRRSLTARGQGAVRRSIIAKGNLADDVQQKAGELGKEIQKGAEDLTSEASKQASNVTDEAQRAGQDVKQQGEQASKSQNWSAKDVSDEDPALQQKLPGFEQPAADQGDDPRFRDALLDQKNQQGA